MQEKKSYAMKYEVTKKTEKMLLALQQYPAGLVALSAVKTFYSNVV